MEEEGNCEYMCKSTMRKKWVYEGGDLYDFYVEIYIKNQKESLFVASLLDLFVY